jgi:hypothetical protein
MICKRNGQRFLRMQQCDFYFFICSVHPCLWFLGCLCHFSLSPVQARKMVRFKEVHVEDLVRLEPRGWLNDALVFAGIKYVLSWSSPSYSWPLCLDIGYWWNIPTQTNT